jgi:hypothetical protein
LNQWCRNHLYHPMGIAGKSLGQRYFFDFDLGCGAADNSRHAI